MQESIMRHIERLKEKVILFDKLASEAFDKGEYETYNYFSGSSFASKSMMESLEITLQIYGECYA